MSCMTKVGGGREVGGEEVPSRAELAQYQRRFIELYDQGRGREGGDGGEEVPSRAELAQYQRRFIELYDQGRGRGEEGREAGGGGGGESTV